MNYTDSTVYLKLLYCTRKCPDAGSLSSDCTAAVVAVWHLLQRLIYREIKQRREIRSAFGFSRGIWRSIVFFCFLFFLYFRSSFQSDFVGLVINLQTHLSQDKTPTVLREIEVE